MDATPAGPACGDPLPLPAVRLSYTLSTEQQLGAALDNRLFDLLRAVSAAGSIRHAAQRLGASYRHVWGSLRKWEAVLGAPLMSWSQGQRARLTDFAERLLWAERQVRLRMQPHLESLRGDLAQVIAEARAAPSQVLRVHASHDLALPVLQQHVAKEAQLRVDISFCGSTQALLALNERQCLLAGFHLPSAASGSPVYARALPMLLQPDAHVLIGYCRRTQGLMVRGEQAAAVRCLADVAALQLRFVNRQPGSGTRLLIDHLLQAATLRADDLRGYGQHVEHTHVAVALCVASGVADAGVGVQAAALQYGLHFVPIVEEDYFLACRTADVGHPGVRALCAELAGARWRQILAQLPGYAPARFPGALLPLAEALAGSSAALQE